MKTRQQAYVRLIVAAALGLSVVVAPVHGLTVHDPTNASLNIQQLAKHAQEITNQIEQIRNQVRAIENQVKMLQNLDISNYRDAVAAMQRIQNVLRQSCIDLDVPVPNRIGYDAGFDCHTLLERFRQAYPAATDWESQPDDQIARYPDQWNAQKRDTAAKAMEMQNVSVESMTDTADRMTQLASASQQAPGQKAAVQVTNEMLVTLSAQLRDQHAATIATQRATAAAHAEEAAEFERNKELIRRATRDADAQYDVSPVRSAFQ